MEKADTPGIMQKLWGALGLGAKPEKTPVPGFSARLTSALKYSWRGVFGFLIPIIFVPFVWNRTDNTRKVEIMWLCMFWFFLVRPVNVPVTGLIPVFYLPMTGVCSTLITCSCYMSENIVLFLMGGILILLLNNSGADRRIAIIFLSSGDSVDDFTAKRLVYKASMAAFLLGFLSNRLLSSSLITEYVTKTLLNAEITFGNVPGEPDLRQLRYVINNAIQTSSSIGGSALMHSGFSVMAFRSLFCERGVSFKGSEYPDIFNYLQYSAFALPLAIVNYVVNLSYYFFLASRVANKELSVTCREHIKKLLKDNHSVLKDMTLHEKLSIIFMVIMLFFMFYRWSDWLGGWSTFQQDKKLLFRDTPLPAIRDATVAALFVVILHTVPMSYKFTNYFTATKRSELPPLKQESAILWWRFSDKNLNYSYFFLIGAGNALVVAIIKTGLSSIICESFGGIFINRSWNMMLLLVSIGAGFICSIMPETAGLCVYLPFILALGDGPLPWPTNVYLPSLAIGIIANYGFLYPFRYSPAYYCHYVGKTPIKKMILQGIVSTIICVILVWLAVAFVAPIMWDPQNLGIPIISPAGGEIETTPPPPPPPPPAD